MTRMKSVFSVGLFCISFLAASCIGSGGGDPYHGGTGSKPTPPKPFDLVSPGIHDSAAPVPTFSWYSSEGAESYTVQISEYFDTPFNTPIHEQTITAPTATTRTISLVSSVTLTAGTQYVWRVLANNSLGSTVPNCYFRSFKVNASGGVHWAQLSPDQVIADANANAAAFDPGATPAYLYIAGFDTSASGREWRIEKRALFDGSLDAAFGTGGVITADPDTGFDAGDEASAIVVSGSSLFVIGSAAVGSAVPAWRIEERDTATGALVTSATGSAGRALAAAVDATSLYLAGYDTVAGTERWHVEKRDLSTGSLETGFNGTGMITSVTSTYTVGNRALAIASYPTGTSLFIAGYDSAAWDNTPEWRIEQLDLATGASINTIISVPGKAQAMAIAGSYLYVAGYEKTIANGEEWRVEQRNLSDCSLVTSVTTTIPGSSAQITALVVDGVSLYAAGFDTNTSVGDREWRVEKRLLSDLSADTSFGSSGVVSFNHSDLFGDEIHAVAVDGSMLYLAGTDTDLQSAFPEWRTEKRGK